MIHSRIPHFYQYIPGWFTFKYLYREVIANAKDGQHFVEVGAWFGRSTAYLAVEIKNRRKRIRFDVVDTWKGSSNSPRLRRIVRKHGGSILPHFLTNMKTGHVLDVIHPIPMDSVSASKRYKDKSLHFVFIDANHDYEYVMADLQAWYTKVKVGGLLAGDDFGTKPGVRKAVNEFFDGRKVKITGRKPYLHWRYTKR